MRRSHLTLGSIDSAQIREVKQRLAEAHAAVVCVERADDRGNAGERNPLCLRIEVAIRPGAEQRQIRQQSRARLTHACAGGVGSESRDLHDRRGRRRIRPCTRCLADGARE